MTDRSNDGLPPGHTLGSLLHRVAVRVGRHGPSWLVRRSAQEIRRPQTAAGRGLNAALRKAAPLGRLLSRQRSQTDAADTLLAVYDLAIEPATFDVLWFLMVAELERRRRGLAALHVVFAGGRPDEEDVPADYEAVVGRSARRDRIMNILAPLAWAVPGVRDVEILHDRRQIQARLSQSPLANIFPKGYSPDLHRSCIGDYVRSMHRLRPGEADGVFRASEAALAAVDRWLAVRAGGKPTVSITIRHYRYMPARNSNLAAWAEVARHLIARGYCPVFIPDTESFGEALPAELAEFPHLNEAAWNLHLRLALYQRAFLNLGTNNGPAHLFIASDVCRGLMFKMLTPGAPQAEASFITKQGFTVGGQLPFCTAFQKWVWEDDTFAVITREFAEMERRILAAEVSPPPDRV